MRPAACTGRDVMDLLLERPAATWPLERDPYLLETSVPGILAVGDGDLGWDWPAPDPTEAPRFAFG